MSLCLGASVAAVGGLMVLLVYHVGSAEADASDSEQLAGQAYVAATRPLEVREFFKPHAQGPDTTSYDQLTDEDKRKTDEALAHILETHTHEAHQNLAGASRFGRQYAAQRRAERKAGLSGIGETAVP